MLGSPKTKTFRSSATSSAASESRSRSPRSRRWKTAVCGGSGTTSRPSSVASGVASARACARYAGARSRRSSSADSTDTTNGCMVTRLPPCRRCQMRASATRSASPASAAPAIAPESLVERDVDAVEEARDLRVRSLVVRHRLPEACAVEMHGDPALPRPLDLGDEVVPLREEPARLALRELEQERRDRLVDRLEVLEPDQPVRVADDPRAEAVQVLVRALLVELEMACRVERDGADSAPVAPDPERDRLGHGAARQEDGGLLAEELRDPLLDALGALAAAVVICPLLGARRLRQRRELVAHRRRAVPCVQIPVGAGDRGADSGIVHHGRGA